MDREEVGEHTALSRERETPLLNHSSFSILDHMLFWFLLCKIVLEYFRINFYLKILTKCSPNSNSCVRGLVGCRLIEILSAKCDLIINSKLK